MKKKIIAGFVSLLVVVVLALPMSVAYATKPTTVSGNIILTYYDVLEATPAGKSDNVMLQVYIEEEWDGGIMATGTTFASWIVHNAPLMTNPDAWLNVHEKLTFQTATVLGATGTLTMELNIAGTKGHWTIIGGTDGLVNLHGQGTLDLTTTPYSYSGKVHFDP